MTIRHITTGRQNQDNPEQKQERIVSWDATHVSGWERLRLKKGFQFLIRILWLLSNLISSRKHEARHRKDHRCEEDGCEARFGTRNDLERHRKSVHGKYPQCGPKESYKCFGRNCGHPKKVWPRLDNFKAHIKLKHNDQNEEDLLSQYIAPTSQKNIFQLIVL